MLETLKLAIRRSRERSRQRRDYEALIAYDDHILKDIGIHRDEVHARLADLKGYA